jgi:glycogen synthase
MKVLLVTREHPPYIWGGMSVSSSQIEKYFPEYGINLTIIAPSLKIKKPYKEKKESVLIYRVPLIGSTFLTKIPSFSLAASQIVKKIQHKFDIIYSQTTPLFCKLTRPFVPHFRTTRYGEYKSCLEANKPLQAYLNKLYIGFDKNMINKANGIIVLSKNMAEEIKKISSREKPIKIIHNGVNLDSFKPLACRKFNSSIKKILYVGRLDARKGLETLFYAVRKIKNYNPINLIIAGEGREKKNLIALASKLSISVVFLGRVPHQKLPFLYNNADLFILPSLYEPFGMSTLEAMACGTPSITSDACPNLGMPRFKKKNVNELAALITKTIQSKNKLKGLSEKSIQISKNYSWRKNIEKIIEFLTQIINNKEKTRD